MSMSQPTPLMDNTLQVQTGLMATRSRSSFALLELPIDVVLRVLEHPCMLARDLCRIEACNKMLQGLVDDMVWKGAFLTQRRCNTLREPGCWKQEYARRESWSRGWRNLPTSLPSSLRRPLSGQTLRRFALKCMTPAPPPPTTHIVDASGAVPGSFPTIGAALKRAKPFDSVLVSPGTYTERLTLDKSVELTGLGPLGSAVIVGTDGAAIMASTRVVCRLARICIEQRGRSRTAGTSPGPVHSGAVLIKGGATMIIEESRISSETGHCIVVQGANTHSYVLHNEIHHGKGVGLLFCDEAKGRIEDNSVTKNGRAGIAILSEADPTVTANKIHDGMDSGVLVSDGGKGRVEENDIFGNRRAGVAILKEGAPLVKTNWIHDGMDSGVLVCEDGRGFIVENTIYANHMAGVAIGRGGASTVTGNTIRDGNGGSLCLSAQSRGLISANVIHHDKRMAMQVTEAMLPDVQKNNLIHYDESDDDDEIEEIELEDPHPRRSTGRQPRRGRALRATSSS